MLRTTSDIGSRRGVSAALLSPADGDSMRDPSKLRGSKFRNWIRQLRLQLCMLKPALSSPLSVSAERRKVPMCRSRRMAALHTLFHLIPLSGALVPLLFQWTQFFIGLSPPESTILQFVAKFHKLRMQVSLVEVVFCIVRSEAIRGFVPLGALSGIAQATQLSYLWSLDFVSLFTSRAYSGWWKALISIAVPTLLAIMAVAGPSSAVLMIPQPENSKLKNITTIYTDIAHEKLFPFAIGRTENLTL